MSSQRAGPLTALGVLLLLFTIVYYIRDPGEGFSMNTLAHAAIANSPEEPFGHLELRRQMGIRPGGFGLLMTKSFADELIYSAKGNEVIFIKYL